MTRTYEALRSPTAAEKHFQAAVQGNRERSPDPSYHYGRFLIRQGRAAEEAELAQAAKRFAKYELARFELGRLAEAETELAAASSLEEARRLLQKVRRQRGN